MARQRPKAPGQRQLRVGEELRHVLAAIFERETFRDPALFDVRLTVTEVRPSPDLRHARIYVVPLGGSPDMKSILEGLRRVKPFLRREVASRVQIKFIPDLIFAADTTFDEAEHISRLLHKPEVARDIWPTDGEDDSPDGQQAGTRDDAEEE
ncbi:MAG: 30S ribosome-binding factor RbfA [Rhodospirillaceae bacterium]|nr:30S ribosome-binding factor RbfA [Rhodospirillaceae bacterium]